MSASLHTTFDSIGITVLERGWLSSNNVLIRGDGAAWMVDTGYVSHADQTVRLVEQVLGEQLLSGIINTHLHSDHCGGNAAVVDRYPGIEVLIPPGQANSVIPWDPVGLTYQPTGQRCPRFGYTQTLKPSTSIHFGHAMWNVIAAPGHDPHAVMLYEPETRVLIAGDALWENGFGVVFPELEGQDAFHEVRETLKCIESLQPTVVIPGHGSPFSDVDGALARAHQRLAQFVSRPEKHAEYAAKVLVKFYLLEYQVVSMESLHKWYASTPYFKVVQSAYPAMDLSLETLVDKLVHANAATRQDDNLINL